MPDAAAASAPAIGSPGFFTDPARTYRALLDHGIRAVRLSPHIVAVTHYQDCLDTLRDPRLSAKRYVRQLAHFTEEQKRAISAWSGVARQMMFFMDPPEHTRVRKLLTRTFSPEALAVLAPRIEKLFRGILDELPRGIEIDFMQRVAHRFPALVIGEILGMPRAEWQRLMEWSDTFIEFISTLQPPFELALATHQAVVEMLDYMRQLTEEKRAQPGPDVISMMLASEEEGDVLSRDEVLAQCILLLVAGHETTRNLLGNGLLTLLRHPAEMARLRQNPALVRSSVEEFLRFESPVQASSRVAAADFDFFGEHLSPGHSLLVMTACANRDARQFPDPDRLDLARKNNAHLTFGAGAHACLGLHLARLEAQIAFPALLDRFPHIELREGAPLWTQTLTIRGLKRLNLVLA